MTIVRFKVVIERRREFFIDIKITPQELRTKLLGGLCRGGSEGWIKVGGEESIIEVPEVLAGDDPVR